MKKHYLLPAIISFIFTISYFTTLTAQELSWAKKYGDIGREKVNSVVHNSKGEIYITGNFSDTKDMGGKTVSCNSASCFFLLHLDSSGGVKKVITNPTSGANDMAIDKNDNIIITGDISAGTATFVGESLAPYGQNDAFLASFDETGNLNWAKRIGGDKNDRGFKVTTDESGDIIVTGQFWQKVFLTPTDSVTSTTTYPFFLAKYSGIDGSFLWAKVMHSEGPMKIGKMKYDHDGNLCIIGTLARKITYDGNSLSSMGQGDMLLMKLKPNGDLIWMRNAGGKAMLSDEGKALDIDVDGNIYIGGIFYDTAYFDNISFRSYGQTDNFLAKYNPEGNVIWAKRLGGNFHEGIESIVLDENKNIYFTGYHGNYSEIGDTILQSKSGGSDVLIAKTDSNGNFLWVFSGGSNSSDEGYGLTLSDNGYLYVAGEYGKHIDWDTPTTATAQFGSYALTSPSGGGDIFLLKFSLDDDNTGIKEFFYTPKPFAVYPNPVQAGNPYLTIDLPLQQNSRLSVYNTTGKLMHTAQLNRNNSRTTVQLPSLTPGMYFLRLNSNNQVYHSKILVE